MSTVADDARSAHRMTRGGADFRRRLRYARSVSARRATALAAAVLSLAVLASCSPVAPGGPSGSPETTDAPTAEAQETLEPAAQQACVAFWGDPDYQAPVSRDVLDRAATAQENGASDPLFYAFTGDDVEAAFEQAPTELQEKAAPVAEWFRTDAASGEDADLDSLHSAMEDLAEGCAPVSPAAAWFVAPGEDGTKPAALTCADVFDTPGTFTVFENANVLTSNMFKLVGRTAQTVPEDRMDDVRATQDLLDAQIAAVDDDGVRDALEEVRAPLDDAVDGDLSSPGLQEPLEDLGAACGEVGYDAGFGESAPSDDGEGLV